MTVSTIVFDLDGTLSDPLEGIANSINHALECHGCNRVPHGDIATHIGPPLDHAFRSIIGECDDNIVDSCVSTYRERYASIGYSENVVYDGIDKMLEQLKAEGVCMGVCTSKRIDFARKIIDMFDLSQYFEFINGGDIGITKDEQIKALIEEKAIDRDAIMIGDRDVDILAAKTNRIHSAGVLWGHGSKGELEKEDPDYLFAEPMDIVREFLQGDARFLT